MIIKIAEAKYQGHVTIMRFSMFWKISFGEPHPASDLDIHNMPYGNTLCEALVKALAQIVLSRTELKNNHLPPAVNILDGGCEIANQQKQHREKRRKENMAAGGLIDPEEEAPDANT
jgi:hypothetical protein